MAGYVAGQDTPQANLPTIGVYDAQSFNPFRGKWGYDFFKDTTAHQNLSGWCRIYATQNTVIASLNGNGTGTDGSVTLNTGCYIDGIFTAITLTSGSVWCYLAKERNS